MEVNGRIDQTNSPHVRREVGRTGVAGDVVPAEVLLARESKFVVDQLKEDDAAVHRLPDDPLLCNEE